ncbi:MAG: winged helix-turn-helix domain-containing protein [Archaeoglobaceae archaeon]
MSDITKGRILYVIKNGKSFFTEIEEETGASSATLGRYLRELEKDGLIISILDRSTGRARPRYKLNESRMDEINKLIEAYLKSEEEQLEKSFLALAKSNPEKARNVIKRLQSFLEKEIFEDEDSGK